MHPGTSFKDTNSLTNGSSLVPAGPAVLAAAPLAGGLSETARTTTPVTVTALGICGCS